MGEAGAAGPLFLQPLWSKNIPDSTIRGALEGYQTMRLQYLEPTAKDFIARLRRTLLRTKQPSWTVEELLVRLNEIYIEELQATAKPAELDEEGKTVCT